VGRQPDTLADALARYDRLVEVGIGTRTDLAATLADRGRVVTATDVRERAVPPGVSFVRDDVTDPDPAVYADADVVYARNCPPELHRPLRAVARDAGADCAFTTLGGDPPAVPVSPVTLARGTLFVVEGP